MLAKARTEAPGIAFEQADIANWSPPAPADLLFSNATFHWLDGHALLLPRLASHLAPGGVLAVQMPCNRDSPSHLLMDATAADGPWRARLAQIRPVYRSVETTEAYHRILAPVARQVDIWETTYLHVLKGDNPVVEWTKGTALRPYLDALEEPERGQFLATYAARIAAAYPEAAGRKHAACVPAHLFRGPRLSPLRAAGFPVQARTQFSTFRPGTCSNSFTLSVTKAASKARAWAAIIRSLPPIGRPRCSSALRKSA